MATDEVGSRYSSLLLARAAYDDGENVTAAVRQAEGRLANPRHAIEMAYEMQAGSYAAAAEADPARWARYGAEIAAHLGEVLRDGDVLLDGGTGEMTSLASTLDHLEVDVSALAFDISWSRLASGRRFLQGHLARDRSVSTFVGDLGNIALADGAADVAMTVHALEPNGGRERELLAELFRVARRSVVLFEPCYERGSADAQARMRTHGYVRGLEAAIGAAGGRLVSLAEFAAPANALNPTWVFVIDVARDLPERTGSVHRCPITKTPLVATGGVMYSDAAGLAYPVLDGIPFLRPEQAMLAVHLRGLRSPPSPWSGGLG